MKPEIFNPTHELQIGQKTMKGKWKYHQFKTGLDKLHLLRSSHPIIDLNEVAIIKLVYNRETMQFNIFTFHNSFSDIWFYLHSYTKTRLKFALWKHILYNLLFYKTIKQRIAQRPVDCSISISF